MITTYRTYRAWMDWMVHTVTQPKLGVSNAAGLAVGGHYHPVGCGVLFHAHAGYHTPHTHPELGLGPALYDL